MQWNHATDDAVDYFRRTKTEITGGDEMSLEKILDRFIYLWYKT